MKYLLSEQYTDKRRRALLLSDDYSTLMVAAKDYIVWMNLSETSFETRLMYIEAVPEIKDEPEEVENGEN